MWAAAAYVTSLWAVIAGRVEVSVGEGTGMPVGLGRNQLR